MPNGMASRPTSSPLLRALVLASVLSVAVRARQLVSFQNINDKEREFDYFLLVRQWPGTFCSKHKCSLVHNQGFQLTIHGLWPNYKDGTWPQFCDSGSKFDVHQLKDLRHDLEEHWPSVMEDDWDSDETFWEHEWSKHGTCALDVFPSEHSYFKHVLKLHSRYDLAAALRKADIVPHMSTAYRSKDLVNAIHDMYGVRPLVHCDSKELTEIWMCFDKDLRPFSCDESLDGGDGSSSCEEVIIPPLKGAAGSAEGRPDDGAEQQEQQQQEQQQEQQEQQQQEQQQEQQEQSRLLLEEMADLAALEEQQEEEEWQREFARVQMLEEARQKSGAELQQQAAEVGALLATASVVGNEHGDVRGDAASERVPGGRAGMTDRGAAAAATAQGERDVVSEEGFGDREPYEGTTVEESIYWLLGAKGDAAMRASSASDGAAGGSAGTDAPADTAAAVTATAAESSSAGVTADAAVHAATTSDGGAAGTGSDAAATGDTSSLTHGTMYSYLYGDAFPIIQPTDLQQLQQQQEKLAEMQQLDEIEQRLLEQDEQLAAAELQAAEEDSREVGAGMSVGAEQGGETVLAALTALAECTILKLQQHLGVGGSKLSDDELPQPNGGAAAAAAGGAEDFVWTSKLRSGGDEVAFSADEAEERASLGDRGTGATLAVVTQAGGDAMPKLWAVQQVLVMPAGGAAAAAAAAAAAGGPPMWVVLLLTVQLICLVALTLALVVITGMALVGVKWGRRQQDGGSSPGQHLNLNLGWSEEEAALAEGYWQQHAADQVAAKGLRGVCCGAAAVPCLWGPKGAEAGELAEPLLLPYDDAEDEEEAETKGDGDDSDDCDEHGPAAPPRIHQARRGLAAAPQGEGEGEGALEWHRNPLQQDSWQGSVLVLPVAAAAATVQQSLPQTQQPPHPQQQQAFAPLD